MFDWQFDRHPLKEKLELVQAELEVVVEQIKALKKEIGKTKKATEEGTMKLISESSNCGSVERSLRC